MMESEGSWIGNHLAVDNNRVELLKICCVLFLAPPIYFSPDDPQVSQRASASSPATDSFSLPFSTCLLDRTGF